MSTCPDLLKRCTIIFRNHLILHSNTTFIPHNNLNYSYKITYHVFLYWTLCNYCQRCLVCFCHHLFTLPRNFKHCGSILKRKYPYRICKKSKEDARNGRFKDFVLCDMKLLSVLGNKIFTSSLWLISAIVVILLCAIEWLWNGYETILSVATATPLSAGNISTHLVGYYFCCFCYCFLCFC